MNAMKLATSSLDLTIFPTLRRFRPLPIAVLALSLSAFPSLCFSQTAADTNSPTESAPGPKLNADAGVDRVVILPGKTYLNGWAGFGHRPPYGRTGGRRNSPEAAVAPTNTASLAYIWSKSSGPGSVTFSNANAAVTSATFSEPGDYVLLLAASDGNKTASSTLNVKAELPPPPDRLDVVYTKRYSVDSPLWNSRVKALVVNWIPHCIDQINSTNIPRGRGDGGIDNFVEAGKALRGEPHGPHKGYVFANAWVHQTVESMSIALMIDPKGDPEMIQAQDKMRATLEDWIPKILAAQEPDGYLQTAWTLRNTNRWHERWSPESRGNHEGYTAGYFIESAINHYTLTDGKDRRLYDAAKRLADCWYNNLGPAPKKPWYDGHEEMEQALVRFGRFVNDMEGHGHGDHYIQLAKFLLDNRYNTSQPRERDPYDQTHLPVIQQYEAMGHAVRAVYLFSGMADVAAETHDNDYQSAVMSLWDNLINKKYYITGGVGSGETSEGFGPNFSLRNNAYCEACSSCGEIFFQYKMNLAYHNARYADLYEETLYNALLGSVDLEGKNFYYDNPLVEVTDRYPWHACPCCVGNIPRTVLMIPTWTYVKGKDSIYVNLYIGSTVKVDRVAGTDVQMVQKTDYPWSGKVAITVNPAEKKKFTVYVRVPDRQTSDLYTNTPEVRGLNSLAVNGSTVRAKIVNGYAGITRTWTPGDHIDLELPMEIQRVKADNRIVYDRNREALRYGPLLYNIERVDGDIAQSIDDNTPLHAEFRSDLLDGVMVIKGKFANGSDLMAIPNFARDNRNNQLAAAAAASAGNSSIDYSGASGSSTNNATANSGQRRGRSRIPNSIVWLMDEPASSP